MGEKHFSTPNYNYCRIPVKFEQTNTFADERFMKVKIWIAHTGENRNRSIFSKEVLESMIPSLSNIPILGYIAIDENDEKDFTEHMEKLVVEDDQLKIKYLGHAYGVIPEENNARFEFRYGEDGVEREYLVCDGIVWKKFDEVEEIFDRDKGYKSQSLELLPSSIKGHINDEGLFVFSEAQFEGACILGENVRPAMVSSTIERFSLNESIKNEMGEMLSEFNRYFSQIIEEGDEEVSDKQKDNTKFEETKTEEDIKENVVDEEVSKGDDSEEGTAEEVTPEGAEGDTETNFSEKTQEEPVKKHIRTFELSHDDIRSGLWEALDQHDLFKDSWVWISKVYDNHAIVEDESNGKFYKINYVKHENAVSLGEYEELYPMFLSKSEKDTIDSARNNFKELENEVKSLRSFKEEVENKEKMDKLSQYSNTLSEEEFNQIKENISKFSVEDIEKEIGFMLLKKNHFSVKEEDNHTGRVNATENKVDNPYGDLHSYFY